MKRVPSYCIMVHGAGWRSLLIAEHVKCGSGSFVVLSIAALGAFQFRANGIEQGELILGTSEARDGQKK